MVAISAPKASKKILELDETTQEKYGFQKISEYFKRGIRISVLNSRNESFQKLRQAV
jgi:hypothetical protein